MIIKKMTIEDVSLLKFDQQWLYEKYRQLYESGAMKVAWMLRDDNGNPLCAFGALFIWEGVCEVWFNLISKNNGLTQSRILKRYLEKVRAEHNVKRYYTYVVCNNRIAKKFIEFLGFTNETPNGMKNYLPSGEDVYLYARTY
jgi:hypothetical protein